MDLEAQGIARLPQYKDNPGKVAFVQGALTGELVTYEVTREKNRFEKGKVQEIHEAAFFRKKPYCQWFGYCGGCSMQHIDMRTQIALKQRVLEDNLWHLGKVKAELLLRPIAGPQWHYRYRARLSVVNRSIKKGTVLVGFHEQKGAYVADMTSCEVLPKSVSELLIHLRNLMMSMSIRDRIPQIEVAVGERMAGENDLEGGGETIALVLRHLLDFTFEDLECLKKFSELHHVWIWGQSKGIESVLPIYPLTGSLFYKIPEFGVTLNFLPSDFTQVNPQMNQVLVGKAIQLLGLECGERVLDLFCGIGNFTLALATKVSEVLGIEGSKELTQRAQSNAHDNKLKNVSFKSADLFKVDKLALLSWGVSQRWLIDPPRDGAFEIVNTLAQIKKDALSEELLYLPKRIVYVSCNPATLARDAGVLVHQVGYELKQAGMINMFPHTSHVESIAVFDLKI